MDETRVTSSVGTHLNPRQNAPGATTSVSQEGRAGKVPDSVTTRQTGSQLDLGTVGTRVLQNLSELLPAEILNSPALTRAEWAWRQLIVQQVLRQFPGEDSPAALHEAGSPPVLASKQSALTSNEQLLTQFAQETMGAWWATLGTWSQRARQSAARRTWTGLPIQNKVLVPFSQIANADLPQTSPGLSGQKMEVLIDRVLSTITTENGVRAGTGLFVPQPSQNAKQPSQPVSALRWTAQRQTKMGKYGQLVYRLAMQFQLQDWPVEIVFLSAKPSLQVHIKTDHPVLTAAVATPNAVIVDRLAEVGWQIDSWSLGSLSESEG